MITYVYECSNCEHTFEYEQSIKDKPRVVCPKCKKHKLYRVICPPLHVSVTGAPKTLGSLADFNTKNMSDDEKERIRQDNKTKKSINRTPDSRLPQSASAPNDKDTPEWIKKPRTKTTNEVLKLNPEQTKKYVQSGE